MHTTSNRHNGNIALQPINKQTQMKKVFSLMILLATIISFSGCSNDDDDQPSLNDIVGTWKLSQVSTNNGGNFIDWPFETTTATFKSDGTYFGRG
ncbi:MAG: hypothetical protein K2J17_05340, partial [Paramuribaculum sp.]|nr:hypothetical protein [Paramuribaculum sp.]